MISQYSPSAFNPDLRGKSFQREPGWTPAETKPASWTSEVNESKSINIIDGMKAGTGSCSHTKEFPQDSAPRQARLCSCECLPPKQWFIVSFRYGSLFVCLYASYYYHEYETKNNSDDQRFSIDLMFAVLAVQICKAHTKIWLWIVAICKI